MILVAASGGTMKKKINPVETATFAGGCFWCIESDFEKYDGVIEAVSGYTGGHKGDPSYEDVASGLSGHFEAVQVHFDPQVISYARLLDIFWRHVDPTDPGGQFVDRGSQYRTAIFFHNEEQKTQAEVSMQALSRSGRFKKPIATKILPVGKFYAAEHGHQKYYKKNPLRYKFYRANSGRDLFLKNLWPDDRPREQGTNRSSEHDQAHSSENFKS
jgi:peptide methionine sulfoxide reductase msrA/msrB